MNRKSMIAKERDLEAVRLRRLGYTYRDIAEHLSCSVGTVHGAVKEAFETTNSRIREEVELLRELELERLDLLFAPAFQKASEGDPRATDTCLKIMERRAKYLGLDKQINYPLAEVVQVNFIPATGWREMQPDSD